MSDKWFIALILGIIGGFAFAAGSTLWDKTEQKFRAQSRESTQGADVVGAQTAPGFGA